tara:strand:+ start:344 stop:730 length:387 start_codon:yes stop_codon:yes gene_type:complete
MNFDRLKKHSEDNLGTGTDPAKIEKLENVWEISLPQEFKKYLLEIGYAEIYGDEIYSIYEIPDLIACNGLHWMNQKNDKLKNGFIRFFSSDIDGLFYINNVTGKIYLNSTENEFSDSFIGFVNKILDE